MTNLDPIIDAANAGDAVSLARLADLPVDNYFTSGRSLKHPGMTIKAARGSKLTTMRNSVFYLAAPNITIDGFIVITPYSKFVQFGADGGVCQNCKVGNGGTAFETTDIAGGHSANAGGTNCSVINVEMTAPTDASVVYSDRNGFRLVDFISLGSWAENGIRFDPPIGGDLATSTVIGGRFGNDRNKYGKSAMVVRSGHLTINAATFLGNLGSGQVYHDGNPLLPGGKVSNVTPGFFATIVATDCTFIRDPDPNGESCINVNEGVQASINRANFYNCGPWPHRLPVSTWNTSSTTQLTDCVGHGGTGTNSLLPVVHPGATESNSSWDPDNTPPTSTPNVSMPPGATPTVKPPTPTKPPKTPTPTPTPTKPAGSIIKTVGAIITSIVSLFVPQAETQAEPAPETQQNIDINSESPQAITEPAISPVPFMPQVSDSGQLEEPTPEPVNPDVSVPLGATTTSLVRTSNPFATTAPISGESNGTIQYSQQENSSMPFGEKVVQIGEIRQQEESPEMQVKIVIIFGILSLIFLSIAIE